MKKETKSPKTVVAIRRDDSREYGKLHLSFYEGAALDGYSHSPFLRLEFQCDRENIGWYGMHIEIRKDGVESMLRATKLAGPVLAKIQETKRNAPDEIMAAVGAPHWVEDDRCHKWMPVESVQGPELKRWMAMADDSCCVSTMAENEDEAQSMLLKEFSAQIAKGSWGGYSQKLEAWILAGKPAKLDSYARTPDTTPTADLLKPFKAVEEPIVEAVAA